MAGKRALIMAGGGLKVAFQAGVLQVWLDEAGLKFDHADGASGGTFNLAMYCQGMTGTKIADNWRTLDPFLPISLNLEEAFPLAQSAFTYDNFRSRVLPFWGIDWQKIRQSPRLGTFNLFNFSKKRLEVVTQDQMDEDRLISAVSLPMWFPPVTINGDKYIDAVYISDANVEEAIRRGADELWAIWTVSTRDEWNPGFVAQYFHIIEAAADTNFFGWWGRVETNNARIAAGEQGEFGRHIELKLIQAEVPLHYLFNFSRDRFAEAVNLGVATARAWCAEQGIPTNSPPPPPPPPATPTISLQFSEQMSGYVGPGATTFEEGYTKGRQAGQSLKLTLVIKADDVDRFVTSAEHEARVEGTVEGPTVGGKCPITKGVLNLLVHETDPRRKQMRYRLFVTSASGQAFTIAGLKRVEDDSNRPDELWTDTTTLFSDVLKGHIEAANEQGAERLARGIVRLGFLDFLHEMTTFRTEGGAVGARLAALNRFGLLFMGKLWDTYAPQMLGVRPQ